MRAQIVKYKSFKEDWKIKRKEGTKKENLNDFKRGHKEGKKEGTERALEEGRKRANKKRSHRAFNEGQGGYKEGTKRKNINVLRAQRAKKRAQRGH